MSHLPLPRLNAGIALSLAVCLGGPALAQTATQNVPDTSVTAPEAPSVPAATSDTTAAESPAAPAPEAAPAAEAPAAEATPDSAELNTAEPSQAPSQPATTAAPPLAEAAPERGITQSVQEVLDPLMPPEARDPSLPHDLSPVGMFWAADWVVKAVMIGLAFASIVTWTVLIAKMLELAGASRNAQAGLRRVERSANLVAAVDATGRRQDPVSRMVRAAADEYRRSVPALDQAGDNGIKERVDSHLERIEAVAGRRMARGTGVLATIGSTAPFVGLFGTVWGIMNSFIGISEAQTTNLAVVAPGIAEALLATAIGLIAAIPAVVIYNVFARAITGYRLRLANAAASIRRTLSRDLDFRGVASTPEV